MPRTDCITVLSSSYFLGFYSTLGSPEEFLKSDVPRTVGLHSWVSGGQIAHSLTGSISTRMFPVMLELKYMLIQRRLDRIRSYGSYHYFLDSHNVLNVLDSHKWIESSIFKTVREVSYSNILLDILLISIK